MKKYILSLILFIILITPTFWAGTVIWSLPNAPFYTYKINDTNIYFFNKVWDYINIYDEHGILINSFFQGFFSWNLSTATSFMIFESDNYIYIWIQGFYYYSAPYSATYTNVKFALHRINKTTWLLQTNFLPICSWNTTNGAFSSFSNFSSSASLYNDTPPILATLCPSPKWFMNGNNFVISFWDGKSIEVNTQENNNSFTYNTYTWTTLFLNMEQLNFNVKYRLSNNSLNYLDNANKTYNWVLTDTVGDVVRINDVFVSTYTFGRYTYLYDPLTQKSNLSIMSSDALNMRSYLDYSIGTVNYTDWQYYNGVYNGNLVNIQPPLTMGYDYSVNNFNTNIWLITSWWQPVFYRLNSSLQLKKDTVIDTTNILTPFPQVIVSWWGGSLGGNLLTSSGTTTIWTWTGAISYDGSVFNFDTNGDGSVGVLNWELFVWIWNVFKYFFDKLISFFSNIKALIEKLGGSFTSEVKTLSFIPSVHAYSGVAISSYFNNNVDEVAYKQTTIWKIDLLIKWFIAFFILTIWIAFFIWINRHKNG